MTAKHQEIAGFIWSVADLLRGDYRQTEYGKVILPFTLLRRLGCAALESKDEIEAEVVKFKSRGIQNYEHRLEKIAPYYNISSDSYEDVVAKDAELSKRLRAYISGFSSKTASVLENYEFDQQIDRLERAGLLAPVARKFASIDLKPQKVDNHQMGYIFEDLIRRFSEISNDTAGEHFTPREVVRLMVDLLLVPDEAELSASDAVVKRIYDPACGTGGILAEAHAHILKSNPDAEITLYGQEVNPESYAICQSDMMLKGQEAGNIKLGNSFTHDLHAGLSFDYMLANPPFGVEWSKVKDYIAAEARDENGRFSAGLPRVSDGSLLFLQHILHKMKSPRDGGSRIAIVFNGSPLFGGGAETGESNIRRWILENDWLEAVIALPDQLFYNTGIATYFWILSNRKRSEYKERVILFDAREFSDRLRPSLGEKRKFISDPQIKRITDAYRSALAISKDPAHPLNAKVQVVDYREFGYRRITIERPLKLRFEVTDYALGQLLESKALKNYVHRDKLTQGLRSLMGNPPVWKKIEFATRVTLALADVGIGKLPASAEKALWAAVGVQDPDGELQVDRSGNILPDPDLREYDNIGLDEDAESYLEREIRPLVPDAWIDHDKTKTGYEIPFTRRFFSFNQPRRLEEINADLKRVESEIQQLLEKEIS
ncbi:N-6 DNA methylase [Streptomyces sp. NPDC015144]|uniref:type I restriction-modification system subunit M n=1 Tax=Streptomyces sp. NPDC015144 TaxID=3364944 RepID=UPI0036F9DBBC